MKIERTSKQIEDKINEFNKILQRRNLVDKMREGPVNILDAFESEIDIELSKDLFDGKNTKTLIEYMNSNLRLPANRILQAFNRRYGCAVAEELKRRYDLFKF